MIVRHTLGYALTALMSCAATWLVTAPGATTSAPQKTPAAAHAGRSAAAPQPDAGALIAVSSDGNVTLRVEQQPLEWVLEQIARQSGWSDVKERARPALAAATSGAGAEASAATTDTVCPETPLLQPAQADRLLQTLQRGTESDRFDGLLRARADGVPLPDGMLRTMFETDASESVRLLAFESYLEPRSGDTAALRTALEAGLYVPNAAIQNEARKRLDELREMARIDADSGQGAAAHD